MKLHPRNFWALFAGKLGGFLHEIFIHRGGAFASVGDGPYDQRLTALTVTRREKSGRGTHPVFAHFDVAARIEFATVLGHDAIGFRPYKSEGQHREIAGPDLFGSGKLFQLGTSPRLRV